ncbi:MAG: LCP family protein [Actinomycetia bacterium]|nr:LCP family protein [Actinomycetes bacterium]
MPETSSAPEQDVRAVPRGRHFRNDGLVSRSGLWAALCCIALLLVVMGAGGVAALRLRHNVSTDALNLGGSENLEDGPLDILVIGSDTRAGANSAYGDAADASSEARSDVMMLVQISQDRQNVSVVSFPRDLMVDIPQCTNQKTGQTYPESPDTQINESLDHGGPGCTVATINKITGINIDHFMLVDFNAVKQLSSVVGGVQVCVDQAIDDPYSGLKLPKGKSEVEGEQALSFLRSRHGFGDGSDTTRIKAQQAFLASLLRKVKAQGTLTNPGTMYRIAEAITQNVTVDAGLTDPSTLVSIGSIFADVDLDKVVFATVPNEPYPANPNKLQLSDSAQQVFATLRKDGSLAASEQPSASAQPSPSASVDRSVPVSVIDATGTGSQGQHVADLVEKLGYTQVTHQQAQNQLAGTTVYYSTGYEEQAQQIGEALGVAAEQIQPSEAYVGVAVLPGLDFTSGDKVKADDQKIVGGASGQTAQESPCQQAFGY